MAVTTFADGTLTPVIEAIESTTDATPIVVTITGHSFSNGDTVLVHSHQINVAANARWTVANATANTFELSGSVGSGAGNGGATGSVCKEHIVSDIDEAGVFKFNASRVNQADGDYLECRVYKVMRTGGALQLKYPPWGFPDAPEFEPWLESPVISNSLTDSPSVRVTLMQILGTAFSIDWIVEKHV